MEHLPEELGARVSRSVAATSAASSFDALSRAESELTALRDALDEAIALAPALERDLRELSDLPPPLPARQPEGVFAGIFPTPIGAELRASAAQLVDIVRARDPGVVAGDLGRGAVGVTFRDLGAPFSATATPRKDDILMWIATTVRRGTPRLRVRGVVFMRRDPPLGDPAFDDLFEAHGSDLARSLLTQPVRNALVELSRVDLPVLEVSNGIASLVWRFDPSPQSLSAAIHALARLREVEIDLGVLTPSGPSG